MTDTKEPQTPPSPPPSPPDGTADDTTADVLARVEHVYRQVNATTARAAAQGWAAYQARRNEKREARAAQQAFEEEVVVRTYETPALYQKDMGPMRRAGYEPESVVEDTKQPSFLKLLLLGFVFARPKRSLVVTWRKVR